MQSKEMMEAVLAKAQGIDLNQGINTDNVSRSAINTGTLSVGGDMVFGDRIGAGAAKPQSSIGIAARAEDILTLKQLKRKIDLKQPISEAEADKYYEVLDNYNFSFQKEGTEYVMVSQEGNILDRDSMLRQLGMMIKNEPSSPVTLHGGAGAGAGSIHNSGTINADKIKFDSSIHDDSVRTTATGGAGGQASASGNQVVVNVNAPSANIPIGRQSPKLEDMLATTSDDFKRRTYALEQLKEFFLEERYEGPRSHNCSQYKRYIQEATQGAMTFGYSEVKKQHFLSKDDCPLSPQESIKALKSVIGSLQNNTVHETKKDDANTRTSSTTQVTNINHNKGILFSGCTVANMTLNGPK